MSSEEVEEVGDDNDSKCDGCDGDDRIERRSGRREKEELVSGCNGESGMRFRLEEVIPLQDESRENY